MMAVSNSDYSTTMSKSSSDSDYFSKVPQKNPARKSRAKQTNNTGASITKQPQTFPEKLGFDMGARLVQDSNLMSGSLDLVDRFTFAKMSTTVTTTTASKTTNTVNTTTEVIASQFQANIPNSPAIKPISTSKSTKNIFNLNDFVALQALEELIQSHGRVSHMGILDKSYTFFITEDRTGALYYKVKDKIAVVGGDPLCKPSLFGHVLSEFQIFRKTQGWGIAFLGAGPEFAEYAKENEWTTMCFAAERVLNPMTNPVLHGTARKSITTRNKHLLNPKKEGITLEVYTPRLGKNEKLQQQLVNIYDEWRNSRNDSKSLQAYITIYDPFALPELMTYIYTKDREGNPNGFAALRMLGANNGYHLDPCVPAPGAPKGISDLLVYGSMALLNAAKISYLSLGYEPLDNLGEITGLSSPIANISRKAHRGMFKELPVSGKKEYNDKFQPDDEQKSNLYIIFPTKSPTIRHMLAVAHVSNIKIRKLVVGKLVNRSKGAVGRIGKKDEKEEKEKEGQRVGESEEEKLASSSASSSD